VSQGMSSPLVLRDATTSNTVTPAISGEGVLFSPLPGSAGVLLFDCDGNPMPSLSCERVQMSNSVFGAAYVESTNTLLLTDASGRAEGKLVAVDMRSRRLLWSTGPRSVSAGYGIAVLPEHGIVTLSSFYDNAIRVHRLSDGVRVSSVAASGCSYQAAHGSMVYVSMSDSGVVSFHWNGTSLDRIGVIKAAGESGQWRPLAVIPTTSGRHSGATHLVIGSLGTPRLTVLSLPECILVHTHTLDESMKIWGLAADPCGSAFAVCDASSKAVHVISWPLPGM
jgi:hypothetical protein